SRGTSARCASSRASTRRPRIGNIWVRLSRAPSTSRRTTSIARRRSTISASSSTGRCSRPTRQSRTFSARSRSTRTSCRRSATSNASTPRGTRTRSWSTSSSERSPLCTNPPRRKPPSSASPSSTRRASATPAARRRCIARCSTSTPRTCRPSRVYQTLEQWAELVAVLDSQLDVVTTEREKIDVLMQLATMHEEHFLKADLSAKRLEQVLEIDPNNEEAYFKLERSYRKLRQWLDLVNTYDRHISATSERKTKVDLYGSIAQVYADEVEDSDRAIDAYKNIIDLDDQNVPALESLAKLYDKLGDGAQSIEFMTRVAELTQDTKQRVESFYRIGKAHDEKLGDRVSAQERYEMALDLDPSHLPTISALRQIAIDASDHDKAARYYDQEQSYTTSPRQRARLLVELGKLRDQMLGDHPSAVLAWEAAYEADGENEDAAMPLVDEYIAQQDWAKAEPLLDLLVRKSGKRERSEQHAL